MDITENIKQKAEDLIKKAAALPGINIQWEMPITIHCNALSTLEALKAANVFDLFQDFKKHPAIYYFVIKNEITTKEIVAALQESKHKKERACPKIDKNRSLESKFLYCGSVKTNLQSRYIQHLGFGHSKTYSLQLLHWAKELDLVLEFHYAWLDAAHVEFTELVESALAMKIKPLVGKMV